MSTFLFSNIFFEYLLRVSISIIIYERRELMFFFSVVPDAFRYAMQRCIEGSISEALRILTSMSQY